MKSLTLATSADTVQIGAALAKLVRGGETIALVGDLGAGKTTLTAALVAALGGPGAASPTFSLVNRYEGGRLDVWHVDLYRIEDARELPELGLDDAIGDPGGVVLIEWADKFPEVLPPDHLVITVSHLASGRALTVVGHGVRSSTLATELLRSLP